MKFYIFVCIKHFHRILGGLGGYICIGVLTHFVKCLEAFTERPDMTVHRICYCVFLSQNLCGKSGKLLAWSGIVCSALMCLIVVSLLICFSIVRTRHHQLGFGPTIIDVDPIRRFDQQNIPTLGTVYGNSENKHTLGTV
jgi:hypothetical protein